MVADKISVKIILSFVVVLALLAWFVLAAAGDNVKIVALASGTNLTTISAVLFNVSLDNGTDIVSPVNATFFFNISGIWTRIGNTSVANGCQVAAVRSSCATNITNLTIPDGVYSLNATIYNATSAVSIISLANLSNVIYIDGTSPRVQTDNFSAPFSNGANLSTNVLGVNHTINVSIFDATIGIQRVYLNITNSSGGQNQTFTLTREGSTNNYVNSNLNTSQFNDGEYNLTIYANDSLGNLNNSAVVQRITFDKTAPTIAHSCTPTSVEEGEILTCSCSASDATSGVNTSYGSGGVSFTVNPSTSSSGTNFQTSCTTQDRAGNVKTSTVTFSVSSTTVGSTTGSTSGSGSTTGSTGSGNNTGLANGSSVGSAGSTNGIGNVLPGNQNPELPETKGISNAWIIAIIIIVAIIVGIVVMLKRRKI